MSSDINNCRLNLNDDLAAANSMLGAAYLKLSANNKQSDHWRNACASFERSFNIWQEIRQTAALGKRDEIRAAEVTQGLKLCREILPD